MKKLIFSCLFLANIIAVAQPFGNGGGSINPAGGANSVSTAVISNLSITNPTIVIPSNSSTVFISGSSPLGDELVITNSSSASWAGFTAQANNGNGTVPTNYFGLYENNSAYVPGPTVIGSTNDAILESSGGNMIFDLLGSGKHTYFISRASYTTAPVTNIDIGPTNISFPGLVLNGNGSGITNVAGAANATNMPPTFTMPGDSLSGRAGTGSPVTQGNLWPETITNYLNPDVRIFNFAAGGSTFSTWFTNNGYATNGLQQSYRVSHNQNVFVLIYGYNDVKLNVIGTGAYTTNVFLFQYTNICMIAQTNGSKVVAATIPIGTALTVAQSNTAAGINGFIRVNWPLFANAMYDWDALNLATQDGIHPTDSSSRQHGTNIFGVVFTNGWFQMSPVDSAIRPNLNNTYGLLHYFQMYQDWFSVSNSAGVMSKFGLNAISTGQHSTAVGDGSSATGDYSFAGGNGSGAGNTASLAMGFNANASGLGAISYGIRSAAAGRGAVAIGGDPDNNNPATASADYSVELGSGAATTVGGLSFHGILIATTNGQLTANLNFNTNPHIPSAVTLTGSVFAFSNATPNVLECYFSGGTAYSITKNASAVFGSVIGDGYLLLQPTNKVAVTYTIAPTMFTNSLF